MSRRPHVRISEQDAEHANQASRSSNSSDATVKTDEIIDCPTEPEAIGRSRQCEGCPGQAHCQSSSRDGDTTAEREWKNKLQIRLRAIKRIVLVMSGKGGVGKSTVASQLAIAASAAQGSSSEQRQRVGLLDIDICGPSIARLFDVETAQVVESEWGWQPVRHEATGVLLMSTSFLVGQSDPIMWRGPRKTHLIRRMFADVVWGRLDWLFIDTPPGTSDEHLSVFALLKAMRPDGAVLVTSPQRLSASIVSRQLTFCHKMQFPVLGLIENMADYRCPCCGDLTPIFPKSTFDLAATFQVPCLASFPLDPTWSTAADQGQLLSSPSSIQHMAMSLVLKLAADIPSK